MLCIVAVDNRACGLQLSSTRRTRDTRRIVLDICLRGSRLEKARVVGPGAILRQAESTKGT